MSDTPNLTDAVEGDSCPPSCCASLMWTAEKPATDGWWWRQDAPHGIKRPVEIYSVTRAGRLLGRYVRDGSALWVLDGDRKGMGGGWAGPILEPESLHNVKCGGTAAQD